MEYIDFIINALKTTGNEMGKWLDKPWSYSQYTSLGVAVIIVLIRQFKLLLFYLFGFFFIWGLIREIKNMKFESPHAWANFSVYLIFGLLFFGILFYFSYVKAKDFNN